MTVEDQIREIMLSEELPDSEKLDHSIDCTPSYRLTCSKSTT